MTTTFRFELIHTSKKSRARVGKIHTPHGVIDTPSFVAVGTNAAIKALDSHMVDSLGVQLLFCNTYHLMLQPGTEIVKASGGLHRFMNRTQPIITDSGGFQVFSLAYGSVANELKSSGKKKMNNSVIKITEDGVLFRSYRDGKQVLLTPETSVQAQKDLGADIIIPFDELPPYHIPSADLKESFDRTHRWEKRSIEAHLKSPQGQAMYAVIHGGVDRELREQSCKFLSALPFEGFAIGGSIGKTRAEMISLVQDVQTYIPAGLPIHLLGIGDLPSLQACIPFGIDTFDSSYPTKLARHGHILADNGEIRIKQAIYSKDFGPIDKSCPCFTCQKYSRAYLHHLYKASELSFYTLATIHNIHYMVELMAKYRRMILEDSI
jgi:queuine tRNA-ribosyltransferase